MIDYILVRKLSLPNNIMILKEKKRCRETIQKPRLFMDHE